MNSSSSSTGAEKRQSSGLLAKVKSPLLRNWSLIIVIGVIVLWLSVGALPLAWTHLTQMVGEWGTLQAASGSAMFVPFAILLLQTVCFLVAWAMLTLVIVREVLAFKYGLGQGHSAPAVSIAGLSAPAPVPASPRKPDAADAVAPTNTAAADADEHTPFDMSEAIFDLLPDPDEAEPEEEEEEELLAPAIVEEETVFVYGDPLAGDLPEIFSYDTDLMREVQELREKARTQAQTGQVDSSNVKEEPDATSNSDKEEPDNDEEAKQTGSAVTRGTTEQQHDDSVKTKKTSSNDGGSGTTEQDDQDRAEQVSRDDSHQDKAVKVRRSRKKSSVGTINQDEKS